MTLKGELLLRSTRLSLIFKLGLEGVPNTAETNHVEEDISKRSGRRTRTNSHPPSGSKLAGQEHTSTHLNTGNHGQTKRLQAALEQTLSLFEQSSEWPDLIGFLTKMAKVLSIHYNPPPSQPSFGASSGIPQKWLLSKRLAQCLNPALPSGVHQRVLEVYDIIFQKSPRQQLVHDLRLWSLGLFPFLSHASMSVKVRSLKKWQDQYDLLEKWYPEGVKPLVLIVECI